ncbi:MAG TPA: Ni,Fe-hydrogenase III large subunit [Burkholderiaceae bacterium]|nr:Ni,Fe-hydrogenase III large subunit [Burkholderiaceae bacterium]
MHVPGVHLRAQRLRAPLPIWHAPVDTTTWLALATAAARSGGRLLALWATGRQSVHAAFAFAVGALWAELALGDDASYPDLGATIPCAVRMQRAAADLCDVHALAASDTRPWLDHGAWTSTHPLSAQGASVSGDEPRAAGDYPFVRVEGDGVHEIPVGPVHAGTIEPGHFRFSIVGEKVLRLEERLGYVHKGIERRFTELAPLQAHRLAGRVSGDSTVAFAWAYCMALESALGIDTPPRAQWLRALVLERERVANHLGDLGALGNDAALSFGLAQFSRLREDWQRASQASFGHRFMMDAVVPGGVAGDLDTAQLVQMSKHCDAVEAELRTLRAIYDEHAGLQDRFIGTGRASPDLARHLGLSGLAGRASGQPQDLRCDHPWPPYDTLKPRRAQSSQGDVAARVAVRFDELFESLRLIRDLLATLPAGAVCSGTTAPRGDARGAGWVEGWRGEVFVALELRGGAIHRCHCHDPSWQNWPVLEHAVIGNIVPDFPLINKSFNLSYSGQDL